MPPIKVVIVYDSMYGNTEKIARAVGDAITGDVEVFHADEANASELKSVDLLIIGSPTQAFRPTNPVQAFAAGIAAETVKGLKVAAFDTRIPAVKAGLGLRLILNAGGYAAPRIAKVLQKKGGVLVVPPEGFFVKDKEGPLDEGELERAAGWAKEISGK